MAVERLNVEGQVAEGKVLRFNRGERFSHWLHVVSFFILLFTGLGVFAAGFHPLMSLVGGLQAARLIHRVVAVIFVLGTGAMFFAGDSRWHWEWLRSAFRFSDADKKHIKAFAAEFFGGHAVYPPQEKYNGGEKINSLLTIFGSAVITLSGLVMWFAPNFPAGLVDWAYPLHDLAMFVMTTAVIGHVYLSLIHPDSRASISGMLTGYVPEDFAKAHHAAWYEHAAENETAK